MAIYNGTGGKRTGSVGGETYSVSKGQNIVRAKPVSVANPRSDAQMTQRSQFLSAVRFFQRANQRFFKFAFESKKQKESDYNAFMRANASIGGYITKAQGDAVGFPMVAPFRVTQGSLVSPTYGVDLVAHGEESHVQLLLGAAGSGATAPTTIGEVSALLVATYPSMRAGDIITLVSIYSTAVSDFYNDLDASAISPSDEVIWTIAQFFVDVNDTRTLDEVGLTASIQSGNIYLERVIAPEGSIGGGFVCVSRNEVSGLKVSNTTVALTADAAAAYEAMRSNAHRERILAWWGAQQAAILQGGLAEPVTPSSKPRVTSVNGLYGLPWLTEFFPEDEIEAAVSFDREPTGVTSDDFRAVGLTADKVSLSWESGALTVTSAAGFDGNCDVYYLDQLIIKSVKED